MYDFIFISTRLGPDYGDNPGLSFRKLLFALLEPLEWKKSELRDLSEDTTLLTVESNTRSYRNVLLTHETPPDSNQRPASATQNRRDPKRSRRRASQKDMFDTYFLAATIRLQFLPANTSVPGRARRASLNSRVCDNCPHSRPPKLKRAATVQVTTLSVQQILKNGVARVTDGGSQFVAKVFPPYSAGDPEKSLKNEHAVYDECAVRQRTFIPHLPGFYVSLTQFQQMEVS